MQDRKLLILFFLCAWCKGVLVYSVRTWPLRYSNPNYEVLSNTSEGITGCSVAEGTQHSSLLYNPVCLNGGTYSYVEQVIPSGIFLAGDFSIHIQAKTWVTDPGTIFYFQENEGVTSPSIRISKLILWYDAVNMYLEVYNQHGMNTATLTVDNPMILGSYVILVISYDISKPELTLMTGSFELGTLQLTAVDPPLGLPGNIRLGNTKDDPSKPGFEGQLICFSLFDWKSSVGDDAYMRGDCSIGTWILEPLANTGGNPATCAQNKGYYQLEDTDTHIDATVTPLSDVTATTRLRCADMCSLDDKCVCFTYNKDTGVCRLYTEEQTVQLEAAVGTNYYVSLEKCC